MFIKKNTSASNLKMKLHNLHGEIGPDRLHIVTGNDVISHFQSATNRDLWIIWHNNYFSHDFAITAQPLSIFG